MAVCTQIYLKQYKQGGVILQDYLTGEDVQENLLISWSILPGKWYLAKDCSLYHVYSVCLVCKMRWQEMNKITT